MVFQARNSNEKQSYLQRIGGFIAGVDRHLFGLYVVSRYLEEDSPFLKEVCSFHWKKKLLLVMKTKCNPISLFIGSKGTVETVNKSSTS